MTTINQFSDLPSAEAIGVLANELFPDLTEGVYGVPEQDIPVSDVPEVNSSDFLQGYGGAGTIEVPQTGIPQGETIYGSPDPGINNPEFDWEHPFAYGGSSQESYFNVIDEASAPEASFSKEISDVPYVQNQNSVSYAPVVLSQSQAKEQGKKIDAPTSLGGDKTDKENKKTNTSSRNDSIRIGSKTLTQIRNDFPILSEEINGRPLVWLDNGATTQRPKAVIDRLTYYYEHENSNVHRGAHTLAARSTDAYEDARDTVRDFIGASTSQEIIFVRGTTEAINLVANAYVKPILQPGDEIIVSILEHHANIVPWHR